MTKKPRTKSGTGWVAVVGLDYRTPHGDKRVEAGDRCDDVPETSAKWLAKDGLIVPADGAPVIEDAADEVEAPEEDANA